MIKQNNKSYGIYIKKSEEKFGAPYSYRNEMKKKTTCSNFAIQNAILCIEIIVKY